MWRLTPADHPLLDELVISRLKNNAILLNFLEASNEALAKQSGLLYPQVGEIKDAILSNYSAKRRTNFLRIWEKSRQTLPTSVKNLDLILDGGIKTGSIYELCGLSSSGKSQICMTMAASAIAANHEVFYVDTKRDLAIQRLLSNLHANGCLNIQGALEKLAVVRPACPTDLISILHEFISNQRKSSLLVIDSLAGLFFQLLSNQNRCIGLLSNVKSLLDYIKKEMHVAVVVVNFLTMYDADDSQRQKPALGKFWLHAPCTRVNVARLGGSNSAILTVTKSNSIAVGKSATIDFTENGVS